MTLRLPRVPTGLLGPKFQVWWQRVVEAIEAAIEGIAAALAAAVTAQAAADQAQNDAIAAQADATQALADALAASTDAAGATADAATAQTTADNALALATAAVPQDNGPAWTAATGTASRATFATYAGQTVSNPPTQAEMQAIDDHMVILSQRIMALVDDLKANGSLT